MTTKIKATDLIIGARKLAELYPQAVYNNDTCLYNEGRVINGPPVEGCILGQAMREVSHQFFLEHAGSKGGVSDEEFDCIVGTKNQKEWLQNVQNLQDRGATWGEAVATANKNFPVRIRKTKTPGLAAKPTTGCETGKDVAESNTH